MWVTQDGSLCLALLYNQLLSVNSAKHKLPSCVTHMWTSPLGERLKRYVKECKFPVDNNSTTMDMPGTKNNLFSIRQILVIWNMLYWFCSSTRLLWLIQRHICLILPLSIDIMLTSNCCTQPLLDPYHYPFTIIVMIVFDMDLKLLSFNRSNQDGLDKQLFPSTCIRG